MKNEQYLPPNLCFVLDAFLITPVADVCVGTILELFEAFIDGLYHVFTIVGTCTQHELFGILLIPIVVGFHFAVLITLILHFSPPIVLVHTTYSIIVYEVKSDSFFAFVGPEGNFIMLVWLFVAIVFLASHTQFQFLLPGKKLLSISDSKYSVTVEEKPSLLTYSLNCVIVLNAVMNKVELVLLL